MLNLWCNSQKGAQLEHLQVALYIILKGRNRDFGEKKHSNNLSK
jgi:hypothetical protein